LIRLSFPHRKQGFQFTSPFCRPAYRWSRLPGMP
jgi:hypothetical protein